MVRRVPFPARSWTDSFEAPVRMRSDAAPAAPVASAGSRRKAPDKSISKEGTHAPVQFASAPESMPRAHAEAVTDPMERSTAMDSGNLSRLGHRDHLWARRGPAGARSATQPHTRSIATATMGVFR